VRCWSGGSSVVGGSFSGSRALEGYARQIFLLSSMRYGAPEERRRLVQEPSVIPQDFSPPAKPLIPPRCTRSNRRSGPLPNA
jgi:hypothetical protein